eukprot:746762-Hanusia_phi.AAC.2
MDEGSEGSKTNRRSRAESGRRRDYEAEEGGQGEGKRSDCARRPEEDRTAALVCRVPVVVAWHSLQHELPGDGISARAADVDNLELGGAWSIEMQSATKTKESRRV